MRWWWRGPLCSRPTRSWIVLAHWNNSPRVAMSLHSRHIILILSQPVFALSLQCCVLSEEATNNNFIVFGLTRQGLEPTIYHTWGEHATMRFPCLKTSLNVCFCSYTLKDQGSPNQAKWATFSPWFQWNHPISVKKQSFSRPVSLFKSVFF